MTPIQLQIDQMRDLSARHYPEDPSKQMECFARLLEERLRTYAAMFHRLPVRETNDERLKA